MIGAIETANLSP